MGDTESATTITGLISRGLAKLASYSEPPSAVEHGRVVSRNGLRGVRVGEASHPGPRRRRRVRSSSVESSWSGPDRALRDDSERDLLDLDVVRTVGAQVDASSDKASDAPQQWWVCRPPKG